MFNSFSKSFFAGRRPFIVSTPTQLPSGFVWLDASLGNNANFGSILSDGATVTTWNDVYSGSHPANKAGNAGVKPVWKSNILNGYGVVRFDGVNDSLNINPVNTPSPSLQGVTGFSLFVVAKASSLSGERYLTLTDTGGFGLFHNGTNWSTRTAGGIGTASTLNGDTTKFHLFTLIYNGSAIGNTNRLKLKYDSQEYALNFGNSSVGSSTNASATYLYIGENGVSGFYAGDIATIILYAITLTNEQILAQETYLKNFWGI